VLECFVREREREKCCNVRYGIITMKGDGSEREREVRKREREIKLFLSSHISLSFLNFLSYFSFS
jgi:Mn-dependent DtxR family transcriptional regulator